MQPMRKIVYKSDKKKQCVVCKQLVPQHQFFYTNKCLNCSQAVIYKKLKAQKEDESGTDHETLEEIMSPMEMDEEAFDNWMQFLIDKSPFKKLEKETEA